jgi:hypothetical protein
MKKTYHIGAIKFDSYFALECYLRQTNQRIIIANEQYKGKKCNVYLTLGPK